MKQNSKYYVVNDIFEIAMKIQEQYIKKSDYKDLSISEIHVIEAVDMLERPTMSHVARQLRITVGTLTTAVNRIASKGYLVREKSSVDQRVTFLRITDKGYQALKIHEEFHKELISLYTKEIPENKIDWVYETLVRIQKNLHEYQDELQRK